MSRIETFWNYRPNRTLYLIPTVMVLDGNYFAVGWLWFMLGFEWVNEELK